MRRRFMFLTAGGAAAVLAVAGIAGVAAQTSSEDGQSSPLSGFVERLAANLGIGSDELTSAVEQTRDEMIDEAVANGDLTAERGEALKEHGLGELLQRFGDREGSEKGLERHFGFRRFGADGDDGDPFRHGMFGFGVGSGALAEAADVIGIDVPALLEEMSAGKTLAEVAADHGVTRDELKQGLLDEYGASLEEFLDLSFWGRSFELPRREGREPAATPSASSSATPDS